MYERSEETAFTRKNLPHLPETLHLAQKMGEKLGRSQILFRPL
jgi:hypothetical protein